MLLEKISAKDFGRLPSKKMRISDLFLTLSWALDMGKVEILNHSRRVAYISYEIAKIMNLNPEKINQVVLASLIHDIGIEENENKKIADSFFELDSNFVELHCRNGASLTDKINFLPELSKIILCHHNNWSLNNFNSLNGEQIPTASRIIYLADRIEALINKDDYILFQVDSIIKKIKKHSGSLFDPDIVENFVKLAGRESFWLNISSGEYNDILEHWGRETRKEINLDDLEIIAGIMADIIDRISPFTSRHSTGVAAISAMLTYELGFDRRCQRAVTTASLFHDLGKLIVPKEIIEKKGRLNDREYNLIKQHSFYTYRLLNKIKGIGDIPEWAAYHHERLDGSGYPFHYKAEKLNLGSRIIAVSDVFQALTEDRPYRKAFTIEQALEIIEEMVINGEFDKRVVENLKNSI